MKIRVKQLIQLRYFILALMALGRVAGVEAVFCVDFEDRTNEICRKIKCGICKENKDQYHALSGLRTGGKGLP